jgi:hypothetical protein
MVIRMSQNTQVVKAAFATVRREIKRFFVLSAPEHSSEHWQVAQPETRDCRARRLTKSAAWAVSCALLFVGCNVYDSSLLDSSALASGGADGGGAPTLGGGAADVNGGAGSNSSGAGTSAGGIGLAGADNAGDSSGGTSGSGAGSAGVAGGIAVTGGSGGASGGGQAGAPAGGAGSVALSLIDDMEIADANIPFNDGRQGFWSVANDGTAGGKQTPSPTVIMSMIPGGRGTSLSAFHTTASGYTASGAHVGVDLNRKGATRSTYDASPYTGVHFWIRVEAASPTAVHLAILDKHTDPGGALCCPAMTDCTNGGNIANGLCYDHFGVDLQPLTTTWSERTVTFAQLDQVGWGDNKVTDLDAAHVFAIQFNWISAAMDLWIDDISFVKK